MSAGKSVYPPHPIALDAVYSTPDANCNVQLYEGAIILRKADQEFKGQGTIELRWLPTPDIRLEMEVDAKVEIDLFASDVTIELVDGWPTELIDVEITGTSMSSATGRTPISGSLHRWSRASALGMKSATFHIPNMRAFRGDPICNKSGAAWVGRATLAWDGWKITIDEISNKELRGKLKALAGFGITHVGAMEKQDDSSFSPEDANTQLEALYWLLSFCNGRWTGPILPLQSDIDMKQAWCEWSARRVSPYRHIRSWNHELMEDVLPSICKGFADKWFDEMWSRTIRIAIYWYVTANAPGAPIENGVMVTQVAFETLGWTLFVEDMKSLSSEGYERLHSADKLRLLLTHCGIGLAIPAELHELLATAKADNWSDGPAAISAIRNAHVHPSPKNRARLSRAGVDAEHQATILSLYYVELLLLRLFDYSGEYCSRLIGGVYPNGAIKTVPWNSRSLRTT